MNNRDKVISTIMILIGSIIILTGCDEDKIMITEIKIWDKDFKEIKTINQISKINTVKAIWAKKKKLSQNKKLNFTYKIDIKSNNKTIRWLYDKSGYATILSKEEMPVYKIKEVKQFNKTIIP